MTPDKSIILKRVILWVLLTPLALFLTLMVLLYVPAVQNYACDKAASVMSESLGMDISIGRIDLRFPLNLLARDVSVRGADTSDGMDADEDELFYLGSMNVRVQALPLIKGRVEVDDITLKDVRANTRDLIDGVKVKGTVGLLSLISHGVDLNTQDVFVDDLELSDSDLYVELFDAQTPKDTTSSEIPWKIRIGSVLISDLATTFSMPSMPLLAQVRLERASLSEGLVDLSDGTYQVDGLNLSSSLLHVDMDSIGQSPDSVGMDFSHIRLSDLNVRVDSFYMHDQIIRGSLSTFNLKEAMGLEISSLTTRFNVDDRLIRVPSLRLETPTSWAEASALVPWTAMSSNAQNVDSLEAVIRAQLSKQDLLLLSGLSQTDMGKLYPEAPLKLNLNVDGGLSRTRIKELDMELPSAFRLSGQGQAQNVLDSITRTARLNLQLDTYDLGFLTQSLDSAAKPVFHMPDSLTLLADLGLEGNHAQMMLAMDEQLGRMRLDGGYDLSRNAYQADMKVDSLYLPAFLSIDSLGYVTTSLKALGKGFSLPDLETTANLEAELTQMDYGHLDIRDITLKASVSDNMGHATLESDNPLLKMRTMLSMHLDRDYLDGDLDVKVDRADLFAMGLVPAALKDPLSASLSAEARYDSVKVHLMGGDLSMKMETRSTLRHMMEQGQAFDQLLQTQYELKRLDHASLRRALPYAFFSLKAGKENPLSHYLETMDIGYDTLEVTYKSDPQVGINGYAFLDNLSFSGIILDTIRVNILQDTTRLALNASVTNGPRNPQYTFQGIFDAQVRTEDALLNLQYIDKNHVKGVDVEATIRPYAGRVLSRANGLAVHFSSKDPVIAYRTFKFQENQDRLFLHRDGRVYANIDMRSDNGLGFRAQSDREDSVSMVNMNLELSRLSLQEVTSVLPYVPDFGGLLTIDAFIHKNKDLFQASVEGMAQALTYEKKPVGDIGLGLTYLPGTEEGRTIHYLDTYLTCDDDQVATAAGHLVERSGREVLDVEALVESLPLKVANAFIPDGVAELEGTLNGDLSVSGDLENPRFSGQMHFDDAAILARQVGTRYRLSSQPVQAEGSHVTFKDFAIYTTSDNPFSVNGTLDCTNITDPLANLNLSATNYTLMDAPKTRESLAFGKIFVDLWASVTGRVSNLNMRGNMNVLGRTNATYQLMNTPLIVEDRMDGLVTFVDFSDTLDVSTEEPVMALGGINMIMTVHIDDAVRLRANLTNEGDKYVELVGGGDLDFRYTPQGDMTLNGRYTLTGGTMKYSLPVIPLKEFTFTQGSYVDWRGDLMNPILSLKAAERVRAAVQEGEESNSSRRVDFDVSISISGKLESPDLLFDLEAPSDGTVQNELASMGSEERSKAAITMLATGLYMNSLGAGGNLTMGSALNSVLQSQINNLAGAMTNASFSVGIENNNYSGVSQTDYSFRYSQRFFNDRVQINIGGSVSTGSEVNRNSKSFIDDVSLEYRLDNSGGRYLRAFRSKNYENVLEGEVTETGVGIVFRKKLDRLADLFIFRKPSGSRKKDQVEVHPQETQNTIEESVPQNEESTVKIVDL